MRTINRNQIITKNVLTRGGRLVQKQFLVNGRGVYTAKDHLGRKRIVRIRGRGTANVRSAPVARRVRPEEVMSKIGSSLSGMSLGTNRNPKSDRGHRILGRGVKYI